MSESARLELVGRQMNNIRSGIRSLIYFRYLSKTTGNGMHFWLSTRRTHLEHFVLSFNKSFGSSNEDLHWENTISNESEFKNGLLLDLKTDKENFCKYINSLKKFRNKVIAHTDLELKTLQIPMLDIALNAFNYLYKKLQAELLSFQENLVVDNGPACIEMWGKNLRAEAENYIQVAVGATIKIKEYR